MMPPLTSARERARERARGPHVVTVVGAGAGNLKATVALNLAAALAAHGERVALREHSGLVAATLGVPASGPVALPRAPGVGAPAPVLALLDGDGPAGEATVVVVDPPARLDAVTRDAILAADVVIVPVDATPLAVRVLREVADVVRSAAPAGAPRLRVTLARLLPRAVDRWTLVEQVTELAPDALFHASIPMARRASGRGAPAPRALLYAPGTGAAAAYGALAAELLRTLAPPRDPAS